MSGESMDITIDKNVKNEPKKSISIGDIDKIIAFIAKGVESNQSRLISRAIRYNAAIRKHITSSQLGELLIKYIAPHNPSYLVIQEAISKLPIEPIEEVKSGDPSDSAVMDTTPAPKLQLVTQTLPEVEIYIFVLVISVLIREHLYNESAIYSSAVVERIRSFNRRSLDFLSSKAFVYFSLSYEKLQKLDIIRPMLLALYRTSCIHQDEFSQATLLNLLLRNYLHYNLFDQAHTLSVNSAFPENASHNQFCRYLYYIGRIQSVQAEYSEAYQRLLMAYRKAPQDIAPGFTLNVTKLMIIVQLLMGDIPERSLFNQPKSSAALTPYLHLTQAVRTGDLQKFHVVTSKYAQVFKADKVNAMIKRLSHNVLKTGLRKISISYSRISLKDIAEKLHLSSADEAEYICAKAIKDGVIEATIDHENGWLSTTETVDLYLSEEPQKVFHKRIMFCLDVHNEAVKSMRYPADAYKKSDSSPDDKVKDEEKSIEELIKEMEDEME